MTRISWGMTRFVKRVFPVLWFGTLAAFAVLALASGEAAKDPLLAVVPAAVMVIGFLLMRALVWDAVDEVQDLGDALLVRNGGKEDRIALADIESVRVAAHMNPPRIALKLARPSALGGEIAFFSGSGLTLNPFRRTVVGDDLAARVKRARQKPPKVKPSKALKAKRTRG